MAKPRLVCISNIEKQRLIQSLDNIKRELPRLGTTLARVGITLKGALADLDQLEREIRDITPCDVKVVKMLDRDKPLTPFVAKIPRR